MISREMIYDLMYALMACGGREATLFGDCAPAAREAFMKSLTGETFPELWFELPLKGDAWFDLHSLVSHADIAGTKAGYAGHSGFYEDALTWFASQPEGVRQLALSYDVSAGDVEQPALQLLADRKGFDVVKGFLGAAGRADAVDPCHSFFSSLPRGWYACYTGVFPSRAQKAHAPFLRVECIPMRNVQHAHAHDADLLRTHLHEAGVTWTDDELVNCCRTLASTPFAYEYQFDVEPDGGAGSTLGVSLRFSPADWQSNAKKFAIWRLMEYVSGLGITDDRWRLIPQTLFAKRINREGETVRAYAYPAFIKLRWREGSLLDAKTYLLARVEPVA